MKSHFVRLVMAYTIGSLFAVCAVSQQPSTGLPALGAFAQGPFDTVNLANLDVHLQIPVFSRPGKGIPFSYSLGYDSLIWENDGQAWVPVSSGVQNNQFIYNWGWRSVTEAATGYVSIGSSNFSSTCLVGHEGGFPIYGASTLTYGSFAYHDPTGATHPLAGTVVIYSVSPEYPQCGTSYTTPITNAIALDNSGYIFSSNGTTSTLNARGGIKITPPTESSNGVGTVADANGNQISISSSGVITDTLGTTALSVSGTPPGNVTYTYTAPNNNNATVTVSYAEHWVQTCFAVSGVTEYPATEIPLIDKVTLPDGTYYQFEYETTVGCGTSGKTTGRLESVTLPTGGTISYTYGATNTMMADGSPGWMTRTINGGEWVYERTVQSGQQLPQTTTVVTDPAGNQTSMNFSGIYQTSKNVYSGTTGGTLLDASYICYNSNNNYASCPTATVTSPITWTSHNDALNTNGGTYSAIQDTYDNYGNIVGELDYNFGSGTNHGLLRQVVNNYNSSLCQNSNICDHPSSAKIEDGSGQQYALSDFSYNGTGNATQVQQWASGTSSLISSYTYNGNGTLATATSTNGTVTTYSYSGNSCSGAFPTSISSPADGGGNLTASYAYNCTGGVVTSITDPNGATSSTGYTEAYYWRPSSTTDALGNVTKYNYYDVNNTGSSVVSQEGQVEAVMGPWNSGQSVSDTLATPDPYGRPWLQQTRQGPASSNWDTTETTYLPTGQIFQQMPPYTSAAASPGSGEPAYYWQYDGLGRVTDELNYYLPSFDIHYSYNLNDATVTMNAGTYGGEHTKGRQYEYDALGRLISVCEILASGGSTCQQQNGGNGYNTLYGYDPLGDVVSVDQSGQTRSYSYDGAQRLISESNPESGTTNYTYDTVAASYCGEGAAYSSAGDLVAKADNAGNHVCYYYDPLHRLTDVGNNNQSSTNPCLRYRYDNSSGFKSPMPSGINPQNKMGRMVEAATDNCGGTGDPVLTDEWFSYSGRGEQTDLYESTPNSGGWYHTAVSYWPNGAMGNLTGYLGTGSSKFSNGLTYAPDGEGRLAGLWDGTISKSIWSGTTNNPAGQPNVLDFYNGDSESFQWDANTGHMTSWTSTVGASPNNQQIGSLTWNVNGSLYQMQINDELNTSNIQTCTYGYDDLMRVSTANCGTPWSQTFTYDAWGNINQSGSLSFSSQGGTGNRAPGMSYDANGDVTTDSVNNTYTYNAQARPVAVNTLQGSATAVYDAFLRLVERQSSSGNTQIVLSPAGFKFAYMSGQTVQKYIAPLAAGVQAVYTAATPAAPAYWLHSDWLGSSRLASTAGQTVSGDQAYNPFGYSYAVSGTAPNDFTGQMQDTVSGSNIYDFTFRQYSSVEGRWLVPDPAGTAAVDITNPQTWNRYAYLSNNPLNATDPKGLYCWKYVPYGIGACGISSGSYDMSVAGPGSDGFGGFTPTVQATTSDDDGPDYQINSSGNWYNTSTGEELSSSSVQELGLADPSSFYGDFMNSSFSGGLLFAGQRKGERSWTAKPDKPGKHAKPSTKYPGRWLVKDPHTGNWVLKPPGWTPNQNMDITPDMPPVPINIFEIPWWQYFFPSPCFPDPNTGECL